jgi:hypothetical protein
MGHGGRGFNGSCPDPRVDTGVVEVGAAIAVSEARLCCMCVGCRRVLEAECPSAFTEVAGHLWKKNYATTTFLFISSACTILYSLRI